MSLFSRTTVTRALAAGALLVAIPAGLAFAGGPHRGGPHGRFGGPASAEEVREHMGMMAERALSRVDATAEQRTKVDAILDELAPEAFEARAEMKTLKRELRAELVKPQIDEGKVEKLRKQGVALADERSQQVTDALLEIANVLTPEQRAILGDELAKRAEGFENAEE